MLWLDDSLMSVEGVASLEDTPSPAGSDALAAISDRRRLLIASNGTGWTFRGSGRAGAGGWDCCNGVPWE